MLTLVGLPKVVPASDENTTCTRGLSSASVYQAIATLAFVQIVVSIALYAEPLTGGAMGINNIPRSITTWHLLVFVALTIYVMWVIDRSGIGRNLTIEVLEYLDRTGVTRRIGDSRTVVRGSDVTLG